MFSEQFIIDREQQVFAAGSIITAVDYSLH